MPLIRKDSQEPFSRSPKVQPYNAIRGVVASGQTLNTQDKADIEALRSRKTTQKWQEEAWDYFDVIGEIGYGFMMFADIVSRIRVHGAYVEDDQDSPTPIKVSNASEEAKKATDEAMRAVFGANRQAEILHDAALNFLVVGECYLINEVQFINGMRKVVWRIVSMDELVALGDGFALKGRRNAKTTEIKPLAPGTFIGRMWRKHPRYSDEPISSMRAVCELCSELLLLQRTVKATARSRLNAGALFIPDEFSVSQDVTTDDLDDDLENYVEDEQDEFEQQLINAMVTPISDEGSAASVVPLLIRGPMDAGEKIRLIKFERSFDVELAKRADRTLERILQGINLPKELISGLANVKYNNATQIDQMFYTAHIEPLVMLLCDIFKTIYLDPYLFRAGIEQEEIEKIVIWYDPSGITTAPDRSSAANVGYDKFALSADAWRAANGFSEDDAPTADELADRLALTRGQLTPETTDVIFRKLFPEIMAATRQTALDQSGAPVPDAVQELIDPATTEAPPADPGAAAPADGEAPQEPLPPEGLIE